VLEAKGATRYGRHESPQLLADSVAARHTGSRIPSNDLMGSRVASEHRRTQLRRGASNDATVTIAHGIRTRRTELLTRKDEKMSEVITIYYHHDESGPAELLEGRIARIIDMPLMNEEIFEDDIVQLDRDPEDLDGYARISKVLFSRYPVRSWISF